MGRKRRQYRVAPDNLFLGAGIHLPDGRELQGYVLDLSRGGAGVVLAAGDTDGLDAGTPVEVVLDSYKLPRAIRVRGRLRGWVRIEDVLRCGIEFEDAGSLDRQVPPHLREQFNRRRFPRVSAPDHARVQVSRSLGREACFGEVVDLSAGGMRVVLPLPDARRVDEWHRVWVTFCLPEETEPLHLAALVRNRLGMRVGLEFDPVRSEDIDRARSRIRVFVAQRSAAGRTAG